MFQTLLNAFKIKEVRRKILITIALLFVYRIGCYIPVPGVEVFSSLQGAEEGKFTFLQIMSAVSGGALTYGTFFAMGIGPYINASIIVQLLSVGIPALERLSKQGEEGKRKLNNITRIITFILAIIQAIGIISAFSADIQFNKLFGDEGFVKFLSYAFLVLVYTAGACLTMWIGERITDYGVSNGISMLIFAGILSTAGTSILTVLKSAFGGDATSWWVFVGFVAVAILIFAGIVTVNDAERKIPVQYAKQVKGRKMYGGQSSHIPLKVNASGVLPIIFATAIITFPNLIMQLCGYTAESGWFAKFYYEYIGAGGVIYSILVGVLILFFSYFYAQMQFSPTDVSLNIQQQGGFIPGIRPGKPTTEYLTKVSKRITLFGAIFLAFIAIVPSIVFNYVAGGSLGLINAFTATGMLIVVSVAIELNTQLEAQLMMKRHKNIL